MPVQDPIAEQNHQQLLNTLDIAPLHRPFRNPYWKPSQRRNKTVRQVLSEASRKESSPQNNNSGTSTPRQQQQDTKPLSTLVLEKKTNNSNARGPPAATYVNIESAPSLSCKKRYCDITGLEAPYTDPKTRLRYHDKETFGVIRSLGQGVPEKYLEARGAQIVLK